MKQDKQTVQTPKSLLDGITPGEWRVWLDSNDYPIWIRSEDLGQAIARTIKSNFVSDESERANARLIASAPSLAAENETLKASNALLIDALKYYKEGIDHFYKCINFGKSALDAKAIMFMNDSNIKIDKALQQVS
jgi:hypothetical protein